MFNGPALPIKKAIQLFLLSLFLLFAGVYVRYWSDHRDLLQAIAEYKRSLYTHRSKTPQNTVKIYDRYERLVGEYSTNKTRRLSLNQCRRLEWLKKATVSSEDQDFFEHSGISYTGVIRSILHNIASLSFQQGGGSITQQLARNLFTSRDEFRLTRKIYETYAAFLLERTLSKDEILCLYLGHIYMGEGRMGAYEAAHFYFQKGPDELDAAESAMLVGLFPAPATYSPLNHIRYSLRKQKAVMKRLIQDGHLSKHRVKRLLKLFYSRYQINLSNSYAPSGTIGLYGTNRYFIKNKTPDVNEFVRLFLFRELFLDKIEEGIHVTTTIDHIKQKTAMESMRKAIKKIRSQLAAQLKEQHSKKEALLNGLNGVFLSLEPKSGDILAMVAGFSNSEEGYLNRAFEMQRQPGSTIKALLYALSFEKGLFEDSYDVVDEPVYFHGYQPRNGYKGYKGLISLQKAVAVSSNTVAVKTLHSLGVGHFTDKLTEMTEMNRLSKPRTFPPNLTLALGSGELSPIELAAIYGVFLNSGKEVSPTLIQKVETDSGEILYEAEMPDGMSYRLLSERTCTETLKLLMNVVEDEEGTAHWIGRELKSLQMTFPLAAKTGTIASYKEHSKRYGQIKGIHDAWFAALVPEEVNVVWLGHDRGMPFPGSGSGTAGKAWFDYAVRNFKDKINDEFPGISASPEANDPYDPLEEELLNEINEINEESEEWMEQEEQIEKTEQDPELPVPARVPVPD